MLIRMAKAMIKGIVHLFKCSHIHTISRLLVYLDLLLFILNKESSLVIYKCIPTSFHCSSVIGEGDAVRRSAPVIVLGNAISSRIEFLSRMIASKRSIPIANPP